MIDHVSKQETPTGRQEGRTEGRGECEGGRGESEAGRKECNLKEVEERGV